jgi:hypothetical protein
VLGEANLCERCHALVHTEQRDGKLTCSACGAERSAQPGMVVLSADQREAEQRARRLRSRLLLIGAGVVALAAIALSSRPSGVLLVGCGLLGSSALLWFGRSQQRIFDRQRKFALDQHIVGLAHRRQGVLRASEVAAALGVSQAEADALLSRQTERRRAHVEVLGDGEVRYVFKEAKPTRGIRMRTKDAPG